MMNKKVFVKLIALLMAAAMLLGVCATHFSFLRICP